MESDFWHERWKNEQIGFHQDEINAYLVKHWETLGLAPGDTVFVPMAGKTKDIVWLKDQGFHVKAIELSEHAVRAFFKENDLSFAVTTMDNFKVYQSDGIDFFCGNYFELTNAHVADVKAVFDRASLIAMPPEMRKLYEAKIKEILPAAAKILLISMEYPQEEMDGPPFSVEENEVFGLFSDRFEINLLESFDVLAANPRFADKGLTQMWEKVYLMNSK